MVRKNFNRDIHYIEGGTKLSYWDVFQNKEIRSKFMYYLSMERKLPASFENLHYGTSI